MAKKNTFYSVKQTQREQDPPNFDSVFAERFLLPREVKKCVGSGTPEKRAWGVLGTWGVLDGSPLYHALNVTQLPIKKI